jgi:pimeloyl-ACP methyl ester carboxylesterase
MPRFEASGVPLYYETAGRGRTLVLAHGFACGLRMWDPQVRALSRTHRVVTYDARGHGASGAPEDPAAYSPEIAVDDLRALLDHLGVQRAIVGGLSMGGNVALHFALSHPERTRALLVADTGSGSGAGPQWSAGVAASAAALERDGLEAYADAALRNPVFARCAERGPDAERFLRTCLMSHRARGLAHTARGIVLRRPSLYALEPQLRALAVPTLLVVGEHDEGCTRVHEFLARTIPGARHVVVPGAGHFPNLEDPAAFNRAVDRFLRSALSSARAPGGRSRSRS